MLRICITEIILSYLSTKYSVQGFNINQKLRCYNLVIKPATHRGSKGFRHSVRHIPVRITKRDHDDGKYQNLHNDIHAYDKCNSDSTSASHNKTVNSDAIHVSDRSMNGWSVVPSPGDGHCLIHSVNTSWRNQIHHKPPMDNDAIKALVFTETVSHADQYLPFTEDCSVASLMHGLHTYLLQRRYNQSFGDLVPCIMANAMNVHINIMNETSNGEIRKVDIAPEQRTGRSPARNLLVHRLKDHYNGIACSHPYTDKVTCDTSRLHDSDSIDCSSKQLSQQKNCNVKNPNLIEISCVKWNIPIIMNTNPTSLDNKFDEFCVVLKQNEIDIACVTETWFNANMPNEAFSIDGYGKPIRNDRKGRKGGGVLVYVRSNMIPNHLEKLHDDNLETLWFTVRPRRLPRQFSIIAVGIIYHPPSPNPDHPMLEHIHKCLDHILQKHPDAGILLVGDFNTLKCHSFSRSYSLKQIVKKPTFGKNTLDKVFTNMSDLYNEPEVLPPLGSLDHGHSVVICKPCVQTEKVINTRTYVARRNDDNSKALFVHDLKQVVWDDLYKMSSCREQFEKFHSKLLSLLDLHMPFQTVTRVVRHKPWITRQFENLVHKRQWSFNNDKAKFKYYKSRVRNASKFLRRQFYKRKVAELKESDPRKWWKQTKSILGQNVEGDEPLQALAIARHDGDAKKLADEINSFYQSVTKDLPPLDSSKLPSIPDHVPDQYIISLEKVEQKLCGINIRKAVGPDKIPNWILRDLCSLISKPVCAIFNSSIREGYTPDLWRGADVVSLVKNSPLRDITKDLRPISLTANLMKILESIVGEWLWDILRPHIRNDQYGAVKGSSTTHALVDMLHHWYEAAERGKSTRILLLDYSKAFDLVDHNIIIAKLASYSVPDILLRWVGSFLQNRSQRVRIGQEVSDWLHTNGSVPQGSWLGPLLFIVMINDLSIDNLHNHKYMDDTTLSEQLRDLQLSKMQDAADHVSQWTDDNHCKINAAKTKEMIISFKRSRPQIPPLTINNTVIEHVSHSKLLGVIISDDLKWDRHIDYICSKASKRLHFLTRLKRSGVEVPELLDYYRSVIRSVLEYASPAWFTNVADTSPTTGHMWELEHIQIRAFNIIMPHLSYEQALKESKFPTIRERLLHLCSNFFGKMKNESHRLNYLLPPDNNRRQLRNTKEFEFPKCNTNRFKNSFVMYSLFNFQ